MCPRVNRRINQARYHRLSQLLSQQHSLVANLPVFHQLSRRFSRQVYQAANLHPILHRFLRYNPQRNRLEVLQLYPALSQQINLLPYLQHNLLSNRQQCPVVFRHHFPADNQPVHRRPPQLSCPVLNRL